MSQLAQVASERSHTPKAKGKPNQPQLKKGKFVREKSPLTLILLQTRLKPLLRRLRLV
jgi:hypothetical protein